MKTGYSQWLGNVSNSAVERKDATTCAAKRMTGYTRKKQRDRGIAKKVHVFGIGWHFEGDRCSIRAYPYASIRHQRCLTVSNAFTEAPASRCEIHEVRHVKGKAVIETLVEERRVFHVSSGPNAQEVWTVEVLAGTGETNGRGISILTGEYLEASAITQIPHLTSHINHPPSIIHQ